MGKKVHQVGLNGGSKRLVQAEARAVQAETRTEQARTRTEAAETRTEQAESRTERAKHRTEQAEIRTEQAETRSERAEATLQRALQKDVEADPNTATRHLLRLEGPHLSGPKNSLEQLTVRQRQILQLIAEGQNTKSIAEMLKVSPKTVEYHRMKLMAGLNLHDIPGLVRFALRVGLIPHEV